MRRRLGPLPRGYVVHRIGSTWLVLDGAHVADLVQLRLADPAVRQSLFSRASRRGRGRTPSVSVNPDLRVVLRRYQHGGTLAGVTGSWFLGPSRALKELEVTARAEASGAPVPHVLCLALWPVFGPLWSALIGTREESQAEDLHEVLVTVEDPAARRRLLREVGAAIRKLHDAGVEHRDLQLRNILLRSGEERQIVVVDLDRARFHPHGTMPASRRAGNLGRLARSALKAGLWGTRIGRRDLAALMGGYSAGNRRLRAELRGRVGWERLKLAAHRLSYPFRRSTSRAEAASPPR
jgi:3-deoxy-D-manno-octulosonic acid kinase